MSISFIFWKELCMRFPKRCNIHLNSFKQLRKIYFKYSKLTLPYKLGPSQNHRKEGSDRKKIFFPNLLFAYRMGIPSFQFVRNKSGNLGGSSAKVWSLQTNASAKNWFCQAISYLLLYGQAQNLICCSFELTNFIIPPNQMNLQPGSSRPLMMIRSIEKI